MATDKAKGGFKAFIKSHKLLIIASLIFGMALAAALDHLEIKSPLLFMGIALLFGMAAGALVYFKAAGSFIQTIKNGDYDGFISRLEELRKTDKKHISHIDFNAAMALNRKGDIDSSMEYLGRIDPALADRNLRASYLSLYSANLMIRGERLKNALEYASEASRLVQLPSIVLLRALLELLNGREDQSEHTLLEYERLKGKKAIVPGRSVLYTDSEFETIYTSYLLGRYYYAKNEYPAARAHFREAAECGYDNYYSSYARDVLRHI